MERHSTWADAFEPAEAERLRMVSELCRGGAMSNQMLNEMRTQHMDQKKRLQSEGRKIEAEAMLGLTIATSGEEPETLVDWRDQSLHDQEEETSMSLLANESQILSEANAALE